jgi:glycosyltransferase involved in cell wall biosynthesis
LERGEVSEVAGRRFLIDGSMARGGGGFTYLVNMVPTLAGLAPDDRFLVAVGDQPVAEGIPAAQNVEVRFLGQLGLRQRLRFTYREASRLAAEWGADVYFSAGEMAPVDARCPTIASFRNPNVFAFGRGQKLTLKQRARLWALHGLARLSASRCDRVMFVSEDAAQWIGDAIGMPRRKRSVIHHGIDPSPWRSATPPVGPGDRPYILSVSSVYPYKNFVRLIGAYAELAERRRELPDLVIIGDDQDPAYSSTMERARERSGAVADAIHILGRVPYAEIPRWYRGAALFVFPSFLETFGHPLLEAMASDVPLVAADIPVFREIASDAAFYADPFDLSALAGAMEAALFQPGAAEVLVKRGRQRLRSFTWERTARRLLALFSEVLAEQPERASQPARALSFPVAPTGAVRAQLPAAHAQHTR